MSLMMYDLELSEKDKQHKELMRSQKIGNLQLQGKSQYEIDRILEMDEKKPEELKSFQAVEVKQLAEVTFYFNIDEYEEFKELFNVLEYKGANSTQNWLLIGFLKLIKEGKIQYSESRKEVWVA